MTEADERITCETMLCGWCGTHTIPRWLLDGKRMPTGVCPRCQDPAAKRATDRIVQDLKVKWTKANPRLRADSRIGLDVRGSIIPTLTHRGHHDNC